MKDSSLKLRWMLPRLYIRSTKSPYNTPLFSMILLSSFCVGSKLVYYEYIDIGACGLRQTMGMPCPGCGGTRTTIAFFNFEWLRALSFNPLVFIFCFTWSMQAINQILYRVFQKRVHIRWRYISYRAKFVGATFVFLFNWFVVTQLSAFWIE